MPPPAGSNILSRCPADSPGREQEPFSSDDLTAFWTTLSRMVDGGKVSQIPATVV